MAPNFNFLNLYIQCLKGYLSSFPNEKILLSTSLSEKYSLYSDPTQFTEQDWKKIINFQINRLIGPEAVVISYGHLKNIKVLEDLIYQSVKKKITATINVRDIIHEIIFYISLRDEYLSY